MLLKNACILIIDDDTDVLTAVKLLLKTEVKEVVTEKNPENIRGFCRNKFDLILLDMNLQASIPAMKDFLVKKIKEFGSDASVIMITAYGDIDLAVRSLKEGASDFIVKPWHNEKLLEAIKEILKEKGKHCRSYQCQQAFSHRQRNDRRIGSDEGYFFQDRKNRSN